MPCEYKNGCTQPVIYQKVGGSSEWTMGDEGSAGKRSKGAPISPMKSLNICYYHQKVKENMFDGETYGCGSGPTKRDGRPRIHSPGRE